MSMTRPLWVLLVAFVLATPLLAGANPPDIYGLGARSIALGGAMTAAVDDSSANFYNPAALTRSGFLQLDLGYIHTDTQLRLNDQDVGVDEGSGTQLGVVVPGEIGSVRLAFGLGLFLHNDRISRVRALPQHQPRFVYYDNRPQRIFINTNIAIRPLPWLHIGGGVTFMTETRGTLSLQGLVFLPPNTDASPLATTIDVRFETIRYPSAGILITPSDRWSVGLTWREEVKVELDLGARVEGGVVVGTAQLPGEFEINSFNTNLFTPRQIWLGGTFRPIANLLLTADVGWLDWSRFPAPVSAVTTELAIESFPTDGLVPPPTEVVNPGFDDIFSVRTGIEGSIQLGRKVRLDLRAGYAYEPTPAPEQPGATSYVDSDKHTIGYGIGLTISDWSPSVAAPVSIDLAGQTVLLSERAYNKADPADLVGDFTSDGELFTFAGTVRWRF
jgi:long-chain fatty acid transport protein